MRKARFIDPAENVLIGNWTKEGIVVDDNIYDFENVTMLPPTEPTKIIGVGPNYYSNIEHYGREEPDDPSDLLIFIKSTPNTLVGHGGTTTFQEPGEFHYEGELGVVISERCQNVSRENAYDIIEGFTCINEITNKGVPESMYDPGNRVRSKSFDNSAPVGPIVASADLVPRDATIELRLNGEVKQQDSRSGLIHSVPDLIEEITRYLTLEPGDIIATGSPKGVDQLHNGDHVEIEIEGLGTLKHDVNIID